MRRETMPRLRWGAVPALAFFFGGLAIAAEPAKPDYHVVKKIEVKGEGGWDYLTMDPAARRLYITRGDHVVVLDVEKEKVIGEITKTPGVHGVALVPKRKKGFISNGGDSTVTIFDLETLKEIAKVKVGQRPDAILYDPASDCVFTFNAGSKDSTALASEDGAVKGTVPLGGKPETAVADEKGHIYVNIEDKNEIAVVDSKNLKVKDRWKLAPGEEPTGLAIDLANRRLFASCHNEKMVVMDADNGKVLATPAIGKGTDACVFDPEEHLAFSSNRDGTLTVVDTKADKFPVVANVKTQEGARTMALDTKSHNIYLATARFKPLPQGQRGRPGIEPDSFVILVVGK
jgi:YVTN family beta-propeller protein